MVYKIGNLALAAFGIFIAVGAFLANGGKYDIYSRSKQKPVAIGGRITMLICGIAMTVISIVKAFSN